MDIFKDTFLLHWWKRVTTSTMFAILTCMLLVQCLRQTEARAPSSRQDDFQLDQYYQNDRTHSDSWGYSDGFMSDFDEKWPAIHGNQPKCIPIPDNFTLCRNIGYNQMRLPNLLEHDTMKEVKLQATHFVPLIGLACHSDTRLFLCSLFSPVCLDQPIYPCRNLCEAVKEGCEQRMKRYGFDWPEILRCDKFPLRNDLCIGPRSEHEASTNCPACSQPNTFEAIVDNYCSSKSVIRMKIKREDTEGSYKKLKTGKKKKVYKRGDLAKSELKQMDIYIENSDKCHCGLPQVGQEEETFFAMGEKREGKFYARAIHLYNKKNKEMRKALRSIRKKDNVCEKKGMEIIGEVTEDDSFEVVERKEAKKGRKRNKKSKNSGMGVSEEPSTLEDLSRTTPTEPVTKSARRSGRKSAQKKNKNRKRQRGNKKKNSRRKEKQT